MTNLAGLKRIIISWLYGSAALLVGLPLLIGLYAYWRHPPIPFPLWIACFSLFGTLGYMLYALSLAAKRWRAAVSVLSTFAAIAVPLVCSFMFVKESTWMPVLNAALWLLASLQGRQVRKSLAEGNPPWAVGIWWIGMVGYFFTSLLYPFFRNTEPYTTWINLFGIVTLAITLYQTNRSTLAKESLESGALKLTRIGKETLFRNRALLITLFTIIVAIAALPFLIYAAKQVWSAFIALLKWLASSFTTDDFDRPLEEMGDSYLQPSEPSLFALIMQKVIVVVAIIVIVALAALLIYALYKLIRRWLKRFLGWYGERLEKDPKEGYVDEKEKLLESKEWVGEAFNRVKQRIAGWLHKEPGWDELADNRERVRHAYRRLLLGRIARGYSFDAALTPRETGGEMGRRAPLEADESATIPLYEDVRYGDREPTDEQASAVKPLFRGDGGRR